MATDDLTQRLSAAFDRDNSDAKAFRALAEHLFFKGHWAQYVDACTRHASALKDALESARLLSKAAAIAEDKLSDPETASKLYRGALTYDPEFRPALLGLRQALERIGSFEDMVDVLLEETRLSSPIEKPSLLLRAAQVLESQVGDMPRAIKIYRQVLEMQPANVKALTGLEKNLRDLSMWEELRETFESVVRTGPPPDVHAKVLFKLGKLYETRFADPVRAARCLEMVREIKPGAASVYKDLERLYTEMKNWRALVRLLEAEARLALPPEERARCLQAAGNVLVEKLGETSEADRFFAQAANLAPPKEDADKPSDEDTGEIYSPTAQSAPDPRIKAIESEGDPAEKLRLTLDWIRALLEEKQEPEQAAEWMAGVLSEPVPDTARWPEILFLAPMTNMAERAADAFEPVASRAKDPEGSMLVELGDFCINVLNDRARGIRAFQQALKKNPANSTATARLEEQWEAMGHNEALASLYRWQVAQAKDVHERSSATKKLTRVLTRDPKRSDEGLKLLESAMMQDPSDASAVQEFVQAMKNQGKLDTAETALRQAMARSAAAPAPRRALADLLSSSGRSAEAMDILEPMAAAGDEEARKSFESLVDSSGDWDRKAALLSRRIRESDNLDRKLKDCLALGDLYRDRLQSVQDAVAAFEDALAIDPACEEALNSLEKTFEDAGRWIDLIEVLERKASFSVDPDETFGLQVKIGELWADRIGDIEAASAALEKASRLDPEDLGVLRALEETYTRLSKPEGLLSVLARIRAVCSDPSEIVRCLAKAAEICESQLNDPKKARDLYREVLDVRPDHVPALRGLQRVCRDLDDGRCVADSLLMEAAVLQDPAARSKLYTQGGMVFLRNVGDRDQAEKAFKEAIALNPSDFEAAAALEGIYEGKQEWGRFVDVGLLRHDSIADPAQKNAHALKLGSALEELDRPAEALALYTSVLKASPDDPAARRALSRIAVATGSFEEAALALRKELETAKEEEKADLWERLARLLEEKVHDLDGAIEAYRNAARARGGQPEVGADLERLLLKKGRDSELADYYEEAASKASGAEKAAFCSKAGKIALSRLFDSERAARCFGAALKADPSDKESLKSLKSILRDGRRYEELAKVLEMEERAADGESRTAALRDLALIHERFTGNLDAAKALLRKVLAQNPSDNAASQALARVLRRTGDTNGLVEILAADFEQTGDQKLAAAKAIEIGEIHERSIADEQTACAWYEKALAISSRSPAALSALERLYEKRKSFSDLARVLAASLASDAPEVRRKAAACRLGRLYEEDLDDRKKALEHYAMALKIDASCLEAIRGVQRVARAERNWDSFRKAVEKEISLGGDPARMALLHQGLGILKSDGGDPEGALEHFEKASRFAPGNREVLHDLIKAYEAQGRQQELADALERWAAVAPTGVERAETLLAAARVAEEYLQETDRALELLRRAHLDDPANEEVLKLMGNLLFARGDYKGLIAVIGKEIELAPDRERKSRLLMRAAQIWEDPLGDPFRAAECLQQAVRLNPKAGKAFKALQEVRRKMGPALGERPLGVPVNDLLQQAHAALASSQDEAQALFMAVLDTDPANAEALEKLADIAMERGKARQAAVWLSMLCGASDSEIGDCGRKPSLLMRLGELFEKDLSDPSRAAVAYYRAWKSAPALDQAADAVLRLAGRGGRWEEYIDVRSRSIDDSEPEKASSICLEIALIAEEDLADPARAAYWIGQALEFGPTDPSIVQAAVRITAKAGDDQASARALVAAFEIASIQDEATAAQAIQIARFFAGKLADPETACAWFSRAAQIEKPDSATLREWRVAALAAGAYREADRVWAAEISKTADPAAAASAALEHARFLSGSLGDEAAAVAALKEAISRTQATFELLSELEQIARRAGRWADAAAALEKMASLSRIDSEKADLLVKAADLRWDKLAGFKEARALYANAARLDPANEKAAKRAGGG